LTHKPHYSPVVGRNQVLPRKLQTIINMPDESSVSQLYSVTGNDSQRHRGTLQTTVTIPDEYSTANPVASSVNIIIPDVSTNELPRHDNYKRLLYRHAHTLKNIACRNVASVMIPVAVREYIRRAIFTNIPEGAASFTVGSVAGYLPCLVQFGGLCRDFHNHTYTRWTVVGRLACIILPGAGVSVLIGLGLMTPATSAALSAANFVYTPLRDFIQNYLRCDNNLTPDAHERIMSGIIGAVAYAPNQFVANELMQYGADALSHTYLGSVGANMVARAGVNFFGECLDDVTNLASTSYLTGKKVETTLSFSPSSEHTWSQIADRILNIHASRSSLFSSVLSAATLADSIHARRPAVNESVPGMSTPLGSTSTPYTPYDHVGLLRESAAVGFSAGVGYLPFVLTGEQGNDPRSYDLESGLNKSVLP